MKVFMMTLTMLLAFLAVPNANASLIIMSGLDDLCVGCSLNDRVGGTYVDPNGTPLDGATWIQDPEVWQEYSTFTVFEKDLEGLSQSYVISSLFISYDDSLIISSGSEILFNTADYSVRTPWKSIIDVIALTGELTFNAANGLSFFVNNVNSGATGVIWKGELNSVSATPPSAIPTPSVVGIVGIFITLLCGARRRIS